MFWACRPLAAQSRRAFGARSVLLITKFVSTASGKLTSCSQPLYPSREVFGSMPLAEPKRDRKISRQALWFFLAEG